MELHRHVGPCLVHRAASALLRQHARALPFLPHLWLESEPNVNCLSSQSLVPDLVQEDCPSSGINGKVPFVESSQLVLPFFIPFTPPFQVVLVMQSTTDGTSTR
jgi:hypothetical protein